jgi:CBS domain containing-hemolysin-like protein
VDIVVIAIAAALLIAGAVILTAEEASVALMTRSRIRRMLDAERPGAVALDAISDQPARLRAAAAAVRAAAFAASVAAGWIVGTAVSSGSGLDWAPLVGGIIGLGVGFSVAEALPRSVALQNPEGVALALSSLARPLSVVAYPFGRALSWPWTFATRIAGGERAGLSPWATEDEFRAGSIADEESARDETEEALLDAVSEFTQKVVREVMVPRTDMSALPDTATLQDAIDLIRERGYSRLPVYHDTIDDVRGVLYAKDLLGPLGGGQTAVDLAKIARAPYFVPETKPVDELFLEMRSRTHIAIVADEYGGTAGLVTIEDLLEEIVGEIFDEYDREEPLVVDVGQGRFRLDARLPIDDVNELFGTDIDEDADTIGGVVSVVAGHIPELGESVQIEGLRLTVIEREGTRVRQLEVESVTTSTEEESADA